MNIDFANLKYQHELYKDEIESAILQVARNCNFIMGNEIFKLEEELQSFTGSKHAITCSSGTDALLLSLMALDIKEDNEIITTPFTFISTAETIVLLRAKPVFVDIDEKTYNIDANKIEEKITPKTKAIMPVSLYGQPTSMDKIEKIATKYKLKVIVDGAQSFGSTCNGVSDSILGDISCTSFFPAKPLGCYGDGGAVFTSDDVLAEKLRQLRVHGQNKRYHHKYIGIGGRLDTVQAAVLHVKLSHYKKDLTLRQEVARKYDEALKDKDIVLPFVSKNATSTYAQYSIRVKNRDKVQEKLKSLGIPTAVHYPIPLHLQECFRYLGYKKGDFPISEMVSKEILSLPMNPYLTDEEINFIAENL
ncbi:MAG: DegT/DnrJ/EryC1/StrS family aminotransferase [Campylobacteraceae bacterium]|nr:DegT/DnrJ/EryC1/StrS family aminotransferase [Campylobacteraceae bacterium]